MDRKEKRMLRKQINDIIDSECKNCQHNGNSNNFICKNECPVGSQMQELSKELFLDKKVQPSIEFVAKKLEYYTRRPWSTEEDFYLLHHARHFSCEHLANKFYRTPSAIQQRINLLKKKQKKADGVIS